MKTTVAVLVFCALFALSQAGSARRQSVSTCSEKYVQKWVDELVSDIFDFRAEMIDDYQNIFNGVLDCTKSSFAYFESCLVKTVKTNLKSFKNDAEDSWDKIESVLEKLAKDIKKCL